jgi:anthranilate synthase component I
VRRWERLPETAPDVLGLPEISMMLATDLAVLDHADGSLLLVANAVNYDASDDRVEQAWADAVARLDAMTTDLAAPADSTVATVDRSAFDAALAEVGSNFTADAFEQLVEEAKEAIRAGEVFQVVVSQRFSTTCPADALDVYRALRTTNPSPYMYLLRLPLPDGTAYDVVGSSPEALVKVTGRRAITHPIAGSRPRGKSPEEDQALAEDLLADPKERAEHVMLVDLGRNDVGRVSEIGTVHVTELMDVRRYSHVMHIESSVVGRLAEGRRASDALRAIFPAGTLSGAPKVRAMEIIDELEPTKRGPYGGAVGWLGWDGSLDTCITIRTIVFHDGVAHVQAGAGIVADSVPATEYEETQNKAAALFRAIEVAAAQADW